MNLLRGDGTLPRKNVLSILEDLLRAVHYLHSKGIIHRDIKLENIMLRKQHHSYRPVIIDLGLAHHAEQESFLFEKCGTPGYIAPEIFVYGAKHPKGDVFSLGAIFHALYLFKYLRLFKEPIFKGDTREELIHNNRNGNMSLNLEKL